MRRGNLFKWVPNHDFSTCKIDDDDYNDNFLVFTNAFRLVLYQTNLIKVCTYYILQFFEYAIGWSRISIKLELYLAMLYFCTFIYLFYHLCSSFFEHQLGKVVPSSTCM